MTFSKEKISPLRGADFQIFGHKIPFKEETPENIEKCLFQNSCSDPKLYDAYEFSNIKITVSQLFRIKKAEIVDVVIAI